MAQFGIIASSRNWGGLPPANSTQISKQFDIDEWGTKRWGRYCLPDNTANTYPVIVFFHATGEVGSTEPDLSNLDVYGPGNLLSSGTPLEFVHPVTGIPQRFIYLAIQDQYWSPSLTQCKYILENDPDLAPRIDYDNIFLTGISAGSKEIMQGVTESSANGTFVRGVVPFSSVGWDHTTAPEIAYFAGKDVWGFCGENSPGSGTDGTAATAITINFVSAFSGRYTAAPSTHGGWQTYYDPTYTETIDGHTMGIFQWMAYKMI